MSNSSYERTPDGFFSGITQRIVGLERRLALLPTASVSRPLPTPWRAFYVGAVTLTGAAAVFEDIDPALTYTVTLDQPLWVMVEMSGYLTGAAGTYGMFGVEASGALALAPYVDQLSGNVGAYGFTAYSEVGANLGKTLSAHKPLLLPVGTTTLKMRKMRNTTSGVPSIGYPTMMVTPIAWVGEPGPAVPLDGPQGQVPSSVVVGGGGSATVNSDGTVNFANTTIISLNDVFDGMGNDGYRISGLVNCSAEPGGALLFRLRNAGADLTSGYARLQNYGQATAWGGAVATASATAPGTGSGWVVGYRVLNNFDVTVKNPMRSGVTKEFQGNVASDGSLQVMGYSAGRNGGGPVHSGFTILPNAAVTMSGWLKVVKL